MDFDMNREIINRARSELAGNVMTELKPLTNDGRLILWGVKWNMNLLDTGHKERK